MIILNTLAISLRKGNVASYGAKKLGLLELSGNDLCLVNRKGNLMFNST